MIVVVVVTAVIYNNILSMSEYNLQQTMDAMGYWGPEFEIYGAWNSCVMCGIREICLNEQDRVLLSHTKSNRSPRSSRDIFLYHLPILTAIFLPIILPSHTIFFLSFSHSLKHIHRI